MKVQVQVQRCCVGHITADCTEGYDSFLFFLG